MASGNSMNSTLTWETKDPKTTLDYIVDWTSWLDKSDSIVGASWSVDPKSNLAIVSSSFSTRTTTVVLSGGNDGATGYIECIATTALGKTGVADVLMLVRS